LIQVWFLGTFFFFFFFFFFFANTGEDTLFEIDYKIHIIDMDIML
jgi:hypothetical protein